jgi:hypothetical protein
MRFSISFPAWSALWWGAGFTLQSKRKRHDSNGPVLPTNRNFEESSPAAAVFQKRAKK